MASPLTDPVHDLFFDLALEEAEQGVGRTHPNPPVGAVVVQDGAVVGRGHHRKAGLPHAEVEAIAAAGERARGADLYVTLEPHDHQGRTPPCTEAILEAGLRRVFVGALDPNPLVSGKGIRHLAKAGVEVRTGLRPEACARLVAAFAKLITSGRPLVVLKAAATLDGRIATKAGDSKWVTGEAARALVHRWRDECDAVLVGAGTVRADDPALTTRLEAPVVPGREPRNPTRVVVCGRLRLPSEAKLFEVSAAPTLVLTTDPEPALADELARRGVEIVRLPGAQGRVDPEAVVVELGRRGFTSVLVEGGGEIHASFLEAGVVDELRLFLSPKIVGGDGVPVFGPLGTESMQRAWRLEALTIERVGEDWLLRGRPLRG